MIRPARHDDVAAIETIVRLAYTPYIARLGRRPPPMDHDYTSRVRAGLVTAVEGGSVLGLLVQIPRRDHGFIENVAVAPAAQHRGIGRMLLAHAEQCARDAGLGEVRLHTNVLMTENQALYARLGYVEVGRLGQGRFGRVEMAKRVTDLA